MTPEYKNSRDKKKIKKKKGTETLAVSNFYNIWQFYTNSDYVAQI